MTPFVLTHSDTCGRVGSPSGLPEVGATSTTGRHLHKKETPRMEEGGVSYVLVGGFQHHFFGQLEVAVNRRGYAGFGPCFHLPGSHFGIPVF